MDKIHKHFHLKKKPFKHSSTYYRKVRLYLNQSMTVDKETTSNPLMKQKTNIVVNKPFHSPTLTNQFINLTAEPEILFRSNCFGQLNASHTSNEQQDLICESDTEFSDKIQEEFDDDSFSFVEKLKKWAIKYNITHCAINDMLHLLRDYGVKNLPKDSRTLLKTPRQVAVVPMGKGEYWHNGLQHVLQNILEQINVIPTFVSLTFNMDGLPVYRSSKCELWPILCLINNIPNMSPMIIGIYCGQSKPENAEVFLTPFVCELKGLLQTGIKVHDQLVEIKIKCFICDTPARSFVKGSVSSNHYHGCTKCVTIGEYHKNGHHMSYPRIHLPLRTDESFRKRIDIEHHKERSPLEDLPIDMIRDFPVADSLHLIDLGITKRCLVGWTHGSFNFRTKWCARQMAEISILLEKCNLFRPKELHRAIRQLDSLRFWKGLEFRTFLLYVGPVVLKQYLPPDVYHHFLSLSCAITICSCKAYSSYLYIAEEILKNYIENFIDIYGMDAISSNVHNLCHITEDIKHLGYLPSISAYPFENLLYKIKNLLRNGNRPLAQVAKRLNEFDNINLINTTENKWPFVKKECTQEIHNLPMCKGIFKELHLNNGFVLFNGDKDKWFMTTKNEIVSMINVTYVGSTLYIYGTEIKNKSCFFDQPFKSSRINIYMSSAKRSLPKLFNIAEIKCKLFALPYRDATVFIPLIHTLDILTK